MLHEIILANIHNAPAHVNSRKDAVEVKSLVNSIKQLGLLQPIIVRPLDESTDQWEIVDGHRRVAAMKEIHNGTADAVVVAAQVVRDIDESAATAMSLAANVERKNLHPVEEYEAFAELVRQGTSLKEIAEMFGISTKQVKQRLALGTAIPEVRNAWRDGKIRDDVFTAFAQASQKLQRQCWSEDKPAWEMKKALQDDVVFFHHPMAKFINDELYKEKGGGIVEDLFSERGEGWYDKSSTALDCAIQGVFNQREAWKKEGWGWVECDYLSDGECPGDPYMDYDDLEPNAWSFPTKEAQAEFDAIVEKSGADSWQAENARSRLGVPVYAKDDMAKAGVVVKDWRVYIGKVRRKAKAEEPEPEAQVQQLVGTGPYSTAMLTDMNILFTQAAQVAIASQPCLAQNLLINAMIEAHQHSWESPIAYLPNGMLPPHESPAWHHMKQAVKKCRLDKLKDFGKRMDRIIALSPEDRAELLAALVAVSLRGINNKHELASMLGSTVDVSQFWTPDEAFFNRMKKEALLDLLNEWDVAEVSGNEKKGELVKLCVECRGDWMPEPTRSK